MSYENAPSTKMLNTRCAICATPLRDAPSVERGVGPDCADRYGYADAQGEPNWQAAREIVKDHPTALEKFSGTAKETVNRLIHLVSLEQGTQLAVKATAAIGALGYVRVMAAILTHRTSAVRKIAPPAIMITSDGGDLLIETPYNPAFGPAFRRRVRGLDIDRDERGRFVAWRMANRPENRSGLALALWDVFPAETPIISETKGVQTLGVRPVRKDLP